MPQQTLSGDFDSYAFGDLYISNNTWNRQDLVNGVDFTQSVTFDTDTVPSGITFTWDWGTPAGYRVLAYPGIVAGLQPWSQVGTNQLTATVSDIKDFNIDFDIAIAGDTDKFNVAIEFWLTQKAADGTTDITTEVMIWLHNGDLANGAAFAFDYANGGYSANAIVAPEPFVAGDEQWNYIALTATADYLSGSIDLQDILTELTALGLVDPTDTIGGFEFGAEVTGGAGSLSFNSLSYDFSTYSGSGGGGTETGSIYGDAQNNEIYAGAGAELLYGEAGDDLLWGDGGDDIVYGGDGADNMYGGAGSDVFFGGAGADYFNLYYDVQGGAEDYLYDLTAGEDYVMLESSYQDDVSYFQSGTDAYGFVATGGDSYYLFGANNMTVAALQSTVMFV
jgi:Ca2+-binding RTX toxin-like protein